MVVQALELVKRLSAPLGIFPVRVLEIDSLSNARKINECECPLTTKVDQTDQTLSANQSPNTKEILESSSVRPGEEVT
jgi:hypothetical protein